MNYTLHPETDMGVVRLRVKDLERSISFYERVIGLRAARHDDGLAYLFAEGDRPLMNLNETPGVQPFPKGGYAGLYHYAILVPDRKTLGLVLRNLIQHRVPIGSSDHLVSEALYLDDPDGHGIEIYADRPRRLWNVSADGRVQMAVDPLDGESLLKESEGAEWTGMPAGTTIGHVHLHVSDLREAEQFYHGVLGFDVTASMGKSALFVSAGGYHHHLGLNIWAGEGVPAAPPDIAALEYYTIRIPNEKELGSVLERLKNGGFQAEQEAEGTWLTKDPFGIQIRLELASK